MDIRKRGKKFLLKKVQEVRKYAGLDVHDDQRIRMVCTKILPEDFFVKDFFRRGGMETQRG